MFSFCAFLWHNKINKFFGVCDGLKLKFVARTFKLRGEYGQTHW